MSQKKIFLKTNAQNNDPTGNLKQGQVAHFHQQVQQSIYETGLKCVRILCCNLLLHYAIANQVEDRRKLTPAQRAYKEKGQVKKSGRNDKRASFLETLTTECEQTWRWELHFSSVLKAPLQMILLNLPSRGCP